MNLKTHLAMTFQVFTNTGRSLMSKVVLHEKSKCIDGEEREFQKPFTQTFIMFIGESLVFLPQLWLWRGYDKKIHFPKRTFLQVFLPFVPAFCDLTATVLNVYGLTYTPISIDVMLDGANIIFTTLLSMIFLKNKVHGFEWLAIFFSVVSIVMVSLASINQPDSRNLSTKQKVMGCLLIILSNLFNAGQNVSMEKFLDKLDIFEVIGYQGFWGLVVMSFIVWPVIYFIPGSDPKANGGTCVENILDSFVMLKNSKKLTIECVFYILFFFLNNVGIIFVIFYTSAINYTIVSNIRSLLVWIITLIIHRCDSTLVYGEAWTRWSWLQLSGFIVNVFATLIFNRVVVFKCFEYPEFVEKTIKDNEPGGIEEGNDVKRNLVPDS